MLDHMLAPEFYTWWKPARVSAAYGRLVIVENSKPGVGKVAGEGR